MFAGMHLVVSCAQSRIEAGAGDREGPASWRQLTKAVVTTTAVAQELKAISRLQVHMLKTSNRANSRVILLVGVFCSVLAGHQWTTVGNEPGFRLDQGPHEPSLIKPLCLRLEPMSEPCVP